jgi:hypothetical protein
MPLDDKGVGRIQPGGLAEISRVARPRERTQPPDQSPKKPRPERARECQDISRVFHCPFRARFNRACVPLGRTCLTELPPGVLHPKIKPNKGELSHAPHPLYAFALNSFAILPSLGKRESPLFLFALFCGFLGIFAINFFRALRTKNRERPPTPLLPSLGPPLSFLRDNTPHNAVLN